MLYKEMQKADAHLPTGIKDGNKHNSITFFPYENTLMFALFPFMLHFPYATLHYLNLTYKYVIRFLSTDRTRVIL